MSDQETWLQDQLDRLDVHEPPPRSTVTEILAQAQRRLWQRRLVTGAVALALALVTWLAVLLS